MTKTGKEIVEKYWLDTPIGEKWINLEEDINTELRKVLEICKPIRDYITPWGTSIDKKEKAFVDMVNRLERDLHD